MLQTGTVLYINLLCGCWLNEFCMSARTVHTTMYKSLFHCTMQTHTVTVKLMQQRCCVSLKIARACCSGANSF